MRFFSDTTQLQSGNPRRIHNLELRPPEHLHCKHSNRNNDRYVRAYDIYDDLHQPDHIYDYQHSDNRLHNNESSNHKHNRYDNDIKNDPFW